MKRRIEIAEIRPKSIIEFYFITISFFMSLKDLVSIELHSTLIPIITGYLWRLKSNILGKINIWTILSDPMVSKKRN